jgi:hypothetical protein
LLRLAVQERYKFLAFRALQLLPYRVLQSDRCLLVTAFWNFVWPLAVINGEIDCHLAPLQVDVEKKLPNWKPEPFRWLAIR